MSEPESVQVGGALALVLRVSRCAGVAPLRVRASRSGSWRVAVSPSLAVLHRVLITFLNAIALGALVLDFREDPGRRIRVLDTFVGASVWVFELILAMTTASLATYGGAARMEKLIRILKQLQQIHIDLCNKLSTKKDKTNVIAVVCILTWAIVVQAAEFYFKIQDYVDKGFDWSIMAMYSVFYVAKLLGLLAVMQWGFTAASVHAAADALNHQMLRLCHVTQFTTEESLVESTIRRLALSHEHIGDLMSQMSAGNGIFIMAVLSSIFLHLVVTPYYLLIRLSSNEGWAKTVMVQVGWTVLHLATLMLIAEPCHRTQGQRETTKYLLSRLMVGLTPRSTVLARALDQFVKQTMLTDVKFAPLGMHTLGRPYMAAMFGYVATYLIILLQFQTVTDRNLKQKT